VTFSGDKLLGGPQAGLIAGRADLVARCGAHPLYRALRVDKVTLAALEATLALHARGIRPPVLSMLAATPEELRARATRLAAGLRARGVSCAIQDSEGAVGGGALPGVPLPGPVVALDGPPEPTAHALRVGPRAVVARIHADRVLLDPRTVPDETIDALIDAVVDAIGARDRMRT
jgi:L-seryl-tRNA(Ser) seleniumtransferase